MLPCRPPVFYQAIRPDCVDDTNPEFVADEEIDVEQEGADPDRTDRSIAMSFGNVPSVNERVELEFEFDGRCQRDRFTRPFADGKDFAGGEFGAIWRVAKNRIGDGGGADHRAGIGAGADARISGFQIL